MGNKLNVNVIIGFIFYWLIIKKYAEVQCKLKAILNFF